MVKQLFLDSAMNIGLPYGGYLYSVATDALLKQAVVHWAGQPRLNYSLPHCGEPLSRSLLKWGLSQSDSASIFFRSPAIQKNHISR
jgi:hypothetical protein